MKQLILYRHAKSDWTKPVKDLDRDILPIGIQKTHKSAQKLIQTLETKPQLLISSPAKRAYKTAQIVSQYLQIDSRQIMINDQLYTFNYFDLLKEIKKLPNQIENVVLFGHNQAFTEFTNRNGNQYLNNLPTSGVAIIRFQSDNWDTIQKGTTLSIIKPKDLP